MAGRPPDPKRSSTGYYIDFPDQDFINELDVIAKREGISRKALVLRFLREGMKKHSPGNPQTLLNSYAEGGAQTVNQIVGRVRQTFYGRGGASKREILQELKAEGIDGTQRISIADGVIAWLREQGVKVTY